MTALYVVAGLVILPLIICGIYAQVRVRRLFEKYSKEPVKKGMTGSRLARTMLNSADLNDVVVEETEGDFRDHYDPRQKAVRLSRAVSRGASVAAVGIAAHEAAHAIQDGTGYRPIKIRNRVAPFVERSAHFVLPLILFAALLGAMTISIYLVNAALIVFLGIAAFHIVTLPVELEASSRAMKYIEENGVVDKKELDGVRKVLRAAAITYLIAAALALVQLFRLLGMYGRR